MDNEWTGIYILAGIMGFMWGLVFMIRWGLLHLRDRRFLSPWKYDKTGVAALAVAMILLGVFTTLLEISEISVMETLPGQHPMLPWRVWGMITATGTMTFLVGMIIVKVSDLRYERQMTRHHA